MPRRVLITGASRGIGKAIAEVYKREGWETLTPTREELDLTSITSINSEQCEKYFFAIDVLINNAAMNELIWDADTLDREMCVNLEAPSYLVNDVSTFMKDQHWGRIVNIGSCHGILGKATAQPWYVATKGAMNALTRYWAALFADNGILVNSVCPGFVDTDMTHQRLSYTGIRDVCENIPLGRLAQPSEIAEFVYFLGSEKNTYITGQVIPIDGGYTSCR